MLTYELADHIAGQCVDALDLALASPMMLDQIDHSENRLFTLALDYSWVDGEDDLVLIDANIEPFENYPKTVHLVWGSNERGRYRETWLRGDGERLRVLQDVYL